MKRSRLQTMYLKPAIREKNAEGTLTIYYGIAVHFVGEWWPAGGKLQAELYGQRLPYIRNVRVEGDYKEIVEVDGRPGYRFANFTIHEGDGICLNCASHDGPDYRIVAITPHKPILMELERI